MTRNKKIAIKILLYAPWILLIYVLQSMIFTHLPLFGVKPLLLPVLVVGAALFEGRTYGGSIGLLCGMLCDLSFNQPTVQFTLLLTAVGVGVGLLTDTLLARGFPSYMVCCFCTLVLCGVFQGIDFLDGSVRTMAVVNTIFCQAVYSVLLAFPMYFGARAISRLPKS